MASKYAKIVLISLTILCSYIGCAQEYTPFTRTYPSGNTYRYQNNIKGDLIFIANNILNRDGGSTTTEPVDPYNNLSTNRRSNPETGGRNNFNDLKDMQYIDVDSDIDTFSSSSAILNFGSTDCNQIRYAALYWSATYPSREAGQTPGSDRPRFDQVRLQIPGGSGYIDLTADEILYDGFTNTDLQANSPYACYKDVTSLLTPLADPTGTYTVANVRATVGPGLSGGASAGWTLVIVYENPMLTGKLITTFDGFAQVNRNIPSVNINYSGFTTIPDGPVRANIGAAALEGDFRITGDAMSISTPSNPGFTPLSNTLNPENNFFNSNITFDDAQLTGRNPYSLNTLGYDTDMFQLQNPANSVIANDETSATFRFASTGDQFYPFFNSFNIEIIEPNIVLEKKVEDIAGNDITGQGVNLGQILDYVLSFENNGNDDATNYTIRDVLPINVTLDETNITMPTGTSYTYDPATREVVFAIPDYLVEQNNPVARIRMRVRVAENCFDFVDACTDLIQNVAFSTYEGVINDNQITDDPSVSDFDDCGFETPGATNFLLDDLSDCDFTRTVQLCGDNTTLDAGDNFDSYVWVLDDNENGEIDSADTVQDDGDPDNDASTLVVTQTGTYIVDKIIADPCKGFKEIIIVERFGATQTNPLVDFINDSNNDADATNDVQGEIVQCSVDGDLLPKIFLCGASDTQLIQVNIPDAQSLSWELLDEASCPPAIEDCANKNLTCTYNQVGTGGDFTATAAGKYRLVINFKNGCFSRFYFDVFQNILDIQHTKRDVFCATDGNITITNLGANYGYQLLDVAAGTILVPFNANNGPSFDIDTNGAYRVDVVQLDSSGNPIDGACVFSTPDIGVLDRNFQVDIETTPSNCNAQGRIKIDILDVRADYTYVLRLADGTLVDDETAQDSNTHTFNANPGDYIVEASTADGCTFSQNVTVTATPDPTVLAVTTRNIGCSAGMITLTGSDGFPDPGYSYAIWSHNGSMPYSDISDVPGNQFRSSPIFNFGYSDSDGDGTDDTYMPGEDGDYVFLIVDSNNCFALSNEVTITDNGAMTISITDDSDVSCSGNNDAGITINTVGGIGPFTYSIDAGATSQPSPTFVNLTAGTYDIQVTDSSGCTIDQEHEILEPDAITAEAVLSQNYTCTQPGEITVGSVAPTAGGSGSYQYSIDGGTWTTATSGGTVFTNLTDGTYTLLVRDANNISCSISLPNISIDPLPTAPTASYAIDYNCNGTGNVTVLPNDPTYSYILNGGAAQSSNVFSSVAPGSHIVTIDYGRDCTVAISVPIAAGQVFEANVTGTTNVSCNGQNDGNITFEVSNFDTVSGFEYSLDDGTSYTASTTSPVTTPATLSPGSQTILVRKENDTSCSVTLSASITQPAAIVTTASITTQYNCNSGGATITASAGNGFAPYQYQLENTSGGVIRSYQAGTTFTSITDGDYIVRARDTNGCIDEIDTPISITAPASFTYTVEPTLCYSGANDATVTVNVTGGNGGLLFSINNSPFVSADAATPNSYVFENLSSGSYTVNVQDQRGCTSGTQTVSINPAVTVTASASSIPACGNTTTQVRITASGGDFNFRYALVADGVVPNGGDFTTQNTRTISSSGDYDVYVRDNNGNTGYCEAQYDLQIIQDDPFSVSTSSSPILCSGSAQSTITITPNGGGAPYRYSINDGATYQTLNTFPNLSAGTYDIRVRDTNNCEATDIHVISEPFTLSASALVAELIECNPTAGAEVRIVNARGGTAPYSYSFDGGATYQASNISNLFSGDYTVFVRDANNCSLAMNLTVLPAQVPPGVDTSIDYFCDGEASITVNPDDPQYTYTYEIDNVSNTPEDSNVFTDVPAGDHVITVNYVITTVVPPSTLLTEDFGFGSDTPITEIDPVYCYEPQNGNPSCPGFGTNTRIQDGEYTVTQAIVNPFNSWIVPNDHTGNTDGRYLAINVGGVAGVGGIVYAKRNIEVLPNQDISISLFAINLLRANTSGGDPSFEIQLVDPSGTVIATTVTGNVPKNTSADDWYNYSVDLNPGGNSNLDIVIRTNSAVTNGNDIAIDDILATQPPAKCPAEVSVDVLVEAGRELSATIIATDNVSCNGAADGTVTFEVENFDTSFGFEYSIDGGTTFTGPLTTSPVTVTGLSAGMTDIVVRDIADNSCSVSTTTNLSEPDTLTATAAVITPDTCLDDATVQATPTGGTPTYRYQLEDASATPNIIVAYQDSDSFSGIVAGSYVIRVRDANGCEATAPVTVDDPAMVTFTALETACYSGNADAEIAVNVTDGNGTYQFNINGGPWLSPTPATATTYTFSALDAGSYDVNVKDAYGCEGTPQTLVIEPEVTITASAAPITACSTSTDVTITAAGGDSNFVYALVADGVMPATSDFTTTNPIAANGAGDYDVYVRDNGGIAPFCEASFDITIDQDDPIVITPTVTDVLCNGDSTGAIALSVTGGNAPYEYQLENTDPTVLTSYQNGTSFSNLPAGNDYIVRVRDAGGCDTTIPVTINEPDPIVAEATITKDYTCLEQGEITVGNVAATTGGSGEYQYRVNGGAWSATTTGGAVFTDLEDDTYVIKVRDANFISCVVTVPNNVVIDPLPTEPTLSTSVDYNCNGSGDITVLPNDSAYTYSIDGGTAQTSNVFTNIAVGTHTITVNYGKDCTVDTDVIVAPGNELNASVTASTNVSCNGLSDGTITFELTNFDTVNGFEYSIDGGTPISGTTSMITVSNLSAGTINIEVRDVQDNSCTVSISRTISEPDAVVTDASVTTPYTCDNPRATITASATGGSPTYQYQLEDTAGTIIAPYQTGARFTDLPAGDYIVRGKDANDCSDAIDVPVNIVVPANPTFTAIPTNCYSGNNDATIQVDVTSGNSNYQFSLDGGPWLTPTPSNGLTYTFQNLSIGTYSINVKDQLGCIGTPQNVTINPQLTANAVVDQDLTCSTPASVTINTNGGSGSYSYEWSSDSGTTYATTNFTGNVFNTSNDGTYIFRVTDTSTPSVCTVVSASVMVTPADIPVITSVTPTNIFCNGDSTGTLNVVIDTAIGRPQFTVDVIETTTATNYGTQVSGLPAGDYEVRITDDKGCVSIPYNVSITQPDAIVYDVNLIPITCNPSTGTDPGSITVENVMGGTAEYTYHLTGNNGYSDTYPTTAGGEDHTFAILEFGIYEVDVVDANGCSVRTTNIIASPPDDLDIDVSATTVDCTTGGTAVVTVSSSVGSGNYEFATLETYSSPYSSSYQSADASGGDTATFTGLIPGVTYTFVVHDLTTDCYYFETADTPVNSPSNMTASLDVVANVTCKGAADGNVSFTFDNYDSGATSVNYEIFNSQSNVTTGFSGNRNVNPPTGAVNVANFASLPPGVYYLLLTEVDGTYNGCSIGSPEFSITESSNLLAVTATSPKNDNCHIDAGTINAQAQFGTAPYEFQYLLSTAPAPTVTSAGWTTNAFANVESGDYTVYVKDANNCIQTNTVTVGLDPSPDISLVIVDECVNESTFEVLVTLDAAGISPYQLSVNGASFQNITFDGSNQYTITGLSSGLGQTVSVRDLNGCSETETFDIVPVLQFSVQQTALLDCEPGAEANAEITIMVTSGSGLYEYEIDGPGSIGQTRTTLPSNPYVWKNASAAGAYMVSVYDIATRPPNCVKTVVIDVPDAVIPEFTETNTDVTCNGGSDGTITLQAINNGTNPLTYSINPMPSGVVLNGNTFENLPVGSYDVRAVGNNDCFTDIFSIAITEPDPITVPAPTVAAFGCTIGNTSNNASISISGESGGSGTFVRYEFINDDDPATAAVGDHIVVQDGSNTSYIETNHAGGTYTINVYDDKGCVGKTTATIAEFVTISDPTATVTNEVTCIPGDDAAVTLAVTTDPATATPNLTYSVLGTDNAYSEPNQTSADFTGLGVGNYRARIINTDSGCFVETVFEIDDPNTFEINASTVDVVCFGDDGSVSFTINNPIKPYTSGFTWQVYDTQGTPSLADDTIIVAAMGVSTDVGPTTPFAIEAGSYRVDITQDSNPNCTATEFFNIAGPGEAISGTAVKTEVTCALNDGSIEITNAQGGWGGLTYYVDVATNPAPTDATGFVSTYRFENLSGGPAGTDYQVWIADAEGCLFQLPNENLIDPTPINAALQVNVPNCSNIEGVLEVTGTSGGQGSNYTYQLQKFDGGAFVNSRSPQNTTLFSGLGEGRYQVVITDQWSCSFTTSAQVLYDEIRPVAMVVKAIDCDAVTPGGEITVTQTGGSGSFVYSVAFPNGSTPQPTNTTGVFTTLTAVGTYTFTVTDQATDHACSKTITQELFPQVDPTIQIDAFENVTCIGDNDGSISVSTQDNGLTPYTFEITAASGGSLTLPYAPTTSTDLTAVFTGLEGSATGITYTITVRGDNNCINTITQTITQPEAIVVDTPTVDQFGCTLSNNPNNARISVTGANGGSNTFVRYEFINNDNPATVAVGDAITVQDGSNTTYTETDVRGGTYTINIYDDKGCVGTQTATIDGYDELLTATAEITKNSSCNPGNDGEITVSVTSTNNDTSKFEYSIDNGTTYQASNIFPNLGIDTYVFLIRHVDTGCIITTSQRIDDPNTFTITIDKISDVVCFGTATGELTFELVDASYAGGFDWEIFNTNGTPTNLTDDTSVVSGTETTNGPTASIHLPAGAYYVSVAQNNAPTCNNMEAFTISGPIEAIAGSTETTEVTCALNDGSIEIIDVIGGWGGYSYFVDVATNPAPTDATAFQADPLFQNLSGGLSGTDYQVWIADSEGCLHQLPNVNLIDPSPITADLQLNEPNCTELSAEIEVINEAGGQGSNYSYQLQVFNTTTSTFEDLRPIQTSDIFSGLGAGQYQVVISDQWSCSAITATPVDIYEPIVPLATVVKTIDCAVGDEGGAITITQTGGSGSFDYLVTYPDLTTNATNTTGVFTGLTQIGDYVFTITDQVTAQACPTNIVQSLQAAIYPMLTIDSTDDVTCNGANDGIINVSVNNTGVGPYAFEIVSGDGSAIGSPILPTSSTDITATFSGLTGTATPGITYTIRVTGTNNCFDEQTQIITQPVIIENINATVVQFGCVAGNNGNNATISIDAGITGGSGNYVRYEFINTDSSVTVQNGSNTNYTETDHAGGNYTINIYDNNGCTASTTAYIEPFDVLQSATVVVTDSISCVNGGEDIRIDVVGSLSDSNTNPANYEYRLLPSGTFQASNLFNDLAAGSHALEIRNVNTGCLISVTHFIADPNTFDITVDKLNDVQCFGGDGQIRLSITDPTYIGGFEYMIFDTNGTPADRSDDGPFILDGTWPNPGPSGSIAVAAGTYLIEVMQSQFPQCTQTEVFTITTPPSALALAVSEESSPSCTDDQGSILVDPSGGQGPYAIRLNNTSSGFDETQTGVSAYIFSGLAGGDYDVTVTDALGCPITGAQTLVTPQKLTATIANTNLSCFNDNTASVTATVGPRNITPPYLYQLLTYDDDAGSNVLSTSATQTADNFQNLPAGFYSIRVTDDVGCEAFTAIREITNPTQVTALLVRTSPLTCATGVEFQLSATGGSGTYAYSEDNITFIPMIGNTVDLPQSGVLQAGTYRYYVRDEANGCTAVLSNGITEDPIAPVILTIDASAAVINCNGESTAIINASATGGRGNYQYSLFADAAMTNNYYSAGNFQTSGQFANLPAGTYYVRVISDDCPPDSQEVAIIQPTPLLVDDADDFTDPTCFGDQNGRISVSLSGGAGGYQYALSPKLNQFFPIGEFTDLSPGSYTVIAQDQNGCFVELQYELIAPEPLEATATSTPEICIGEENGTISLSIAGGTAPYRTALNSNAESDFVQDRVDFTDLTSGDYIIVITDANDCETNLIISVDPGVNLNATVTPVYECTGNTPDNYLNIDFEDSSVLGDVLYALDSTDSEDMQLDPDFRNTTPGSHYIAIAHANGCVQTFDFQIQEFAPLTLVLENNEINRITATASGGRPGYVFFFNDENNGDNDTFRIFESGTYTVRIIDENGCETVQSIEVEFIDIKIPDFFTPDGDGLNERWRPLNQEAFPEILTIVFDRYGREISRITQNDAGWDGYYNIEALPSGDYWYVIKLAGENDPREFVGHFTLYR